MAACVRCGRAPVYGCALCAMAQQWPCGRCGLQSPGSARCGMCDASDDMTKAQRSAYRAGGASAVLALEGDTGLPARVRIALVRQLSQELRPPAR